LVLFLSPLVNVYHLYDIGSLFNHSDHPNTSYSLEAQKDSIRFTTIRDIQPDEELCIFCGHNLWFSPAAVQGINEDSIFQHGAISTIPSIVRDDGWSGLLALEYQEIKNPYLEGDPNEVIPQKALPFTELKPPPDEEDPQSIRTSCVIPFLITFFPNSPISNSQSLGSRCPRSQTHVNPPQVISPTYLLTS